MRTRRQIEEIVELPEGVSLEGVNIDGEVYDLSIKNSKDGRLTFGFLNGGNLEYTIQIREGKITFSRYVHRPYHDHNDTEDLQVVIDGKIAHQEEGKILWSKNFPHKGRGYDFFTVPFGSRTVNY